MQDLHQTSYIGGKYYAIWITTNNSVAGAKYVRIIENPFTQKNVVAEIPYRFQCEKMQAFKDALLWLLDHSDIKKDLVGQEVNTDIDGKMYKVKVLKIYGN